MRGESAQDIACPFPTSSWEVTRGENAIDAQLSMLAAASQHVPAGSTLLLNGVYCARSGSDQSWKGVTFESVRWECFGGTLTFVGCKFQSLELTVKGDAKFHFNECTFENCRVICESFPAGHDGPHARTLNADEAALELPDGVWELASLVERGAIVKVANTDWKLGRSQLGLFAQAAHRLHGKVKSANYSRGTRRTELLGLLPILKRLGLVHEDTSRQGHQLELTPEAFEMIGRLQRDPLANQGALLRLFVSDVESSPAGGGTPRKAGKKHAAKPQRRKRGNA